MALHKVIDHFQEWHLAEALKRGASSRAGALWNRPIARTPAVKERPVSRSDLHRPRRRTDAISRTRPDAARRS